MGIITHGDYNSELYKKWASMKNRCNDKNYKGYGADGVTYSEEFERYEDFKEWAYKN